MKYREDLTHAIAMLAQGVINIDQGIEKVEKDSRIYQGMKTVVNLSDSIIQAVNSHEELVNFVREVKRVADDGMLTPQWAKEAKRLLAQASNREAVR